MSEITPELIAAMASKIYNQNEHRASRHFPNHIPGNITEAGQAATSTVASYTPSAYTPSAVEQHIGTSTRPWTQAGSVTSPHAAPVSSSPELSKLPNEAFGLEKISQLLHRAAQSVGHGRETQSVSIPVSTPFRTAESAAADEVAVDSVAETTQDAGLSQFVQGVRASGLKNNKLRFTELQQSQRELRFGYEKAFGNIASSSTNVRPYDVQMIRNDFPILHQNINGHPLIWFDNAATTQKPQSVINAVNQFYEHDNSNIHRAAHTLAARSTDAFEAAREKVRRFIGAGSSREIIWVRGTTEGINLVAQTFGKKFLQPGDEILLSTLEHHANIVPWQLIARETGAKIRVIPVNDAGEIMMSEYQMLLSPRTKLVGITQASNSIGTILPVAEMTMMAHRYGARVLVDGAQSVAHFPVDVRQIDSDFFVFSGHKIFGPTGIGAVYIKEELLDLLPPWQGGGNMIRNVTFEETTFAEPPARFEAGTPSIADAVGLGAALDYVSSLGMEHVARHEHDLLHYATEELSRIRGLKIIGSPREKVSVISFVLPGHRTEEIGKALDQRGIAVRAGHHCAQPSLRRFSVESTVRPSFSIYNTYAEIDCLVNALRQILRQ
jgi:cysteine desulfurase/selenocysteine lyase